MIDKLIENMFFIIIGVILMIYSSANLIKLVKFFKIKAECIATYDKWFFSSDTANKGYKSRFKFTYNGKEIIASESNYLGRKLKKNNLYTIFINPKEPQEIVSTAQIVSNILFFVSGIIMILISFFA